MVFGWRFDLGDSDYAYLTTYVICISLGIVTSLTWSTVQNTLASPFLFRLLPPFALPPFAYPLSVQITLTLR